jgi:hypothetical protein
MEEIKLLEKRSEQIWKEYLTIKGGDFENWYEGLSPIESYLFNKRLRVKIDG